MIKISAFPAATQANPTDLLAKVDDPSGTPVTQKLTIAQMITLLNAQVQIAESQVTNLVTDLTAITVSLATKEVAANKNAASGYAGLDASSKLNGAQQVYGILVNTACAGNDARLSDARTPTAHAITHKTGGTDSIKLDEFAATTDNTNLNVSTTAHGLTPKLPNSTDLFLRGDGTYAAPFATTSITQGKALAIAGYQVLP